jgi:putative RNA 2'-phosphotransferase
VSNDLKALSKFLSFVLRHHPETLGLTLGSDGWLPVEQLLDACSRHGKSLDRSTLELLVRESDKQRFALSPDGLSIRASQGHSVSVELGYQATTPPDLLYHGTVARFLSAIFAEGLHKGQRHHVHLSATKDVAAAVGSRRGKAVLLEIDAAAMLREGHEFFRSANGVWLTLHVPARFLRESPQAEP